MEEESAVQLLASILLASAIGCEQFACVVGLGPTIASRLLAGQAMAAVLAQGRQDDCYS